MQGFGLAWIRNRAGRFPGFIIFGGRSLDCAPVPALARTGAQSRDDGDWASGGVVIYYLRFTNG